jgi:hypothetical protein
MIGERKQCPKCGSTNTVPIAYGFPTPEAIEAARAGKIELGGCIIEDDMPTRACKACGHTWGALKPDDEEED